jgi:stearoyl-CoA desaturase (delta-9 desaturase)
MSTLLVERPAMNRAARTQIQLALVMVIVPLLGFAAAVVMAWERGIGVPELVLLAGMYFLGVLGVEVGMHRFFSHRAFRATPLVTCLLAMLGGMACQGPIAFWVATHRRHHAQSDHSGDPHSPHTVVEGAWQFWRGLWHAHVGWLFQGTVTDLGTYAPDILRDRFVFRLSQLYFLWVFLGLAVPGILGGIWHQSLHGALLGVLWGGLARIFLVHHATWSVNSLCHLIGQRPHATRDHSTNNIWLVLPSLGGSWHNNHHAYPRAASVALTWWQFDPSGWFISGLQLLGQVWDVQHIKRRSPLSADGDDAGSAKADEASSCTPSEAYHE